MIKKVAITVFLLCGYAGLFAQTSEAINNLRQKLASATNDTVRITAQVFLCYEYRLGNTDSSIFYGQQAFNLSQKINNTAGQILSLGFMSITMRQLGNLPRALEMAFKALQIAKANNQENLTAPAMNGISEVYTVLKDYPRALIYLEKQIAICKETNNIEGLAYGLRDKGTVFVEMNRLDSAEFYELKAIDEFRKRKKEEPSVYEILGDIRVKLRDYKGALSDYQRSLRTSLQNNERRTTASTYNKLASFYKLTDKLDSAIFYAQKGLVESEFISQKETIQEAATLLSGFYEQRDPQEAFKYLKIADAYKDSLFGASNIQAVQVLVSQDEEHQKEIDAAKTNYRNQLKQYGLISGLAILLIIAFILLRNNRQKQRTNKVLENTLSDLKSTQAQLIQSEKMASLGELTAGIAHEIQNPLNFVNNFSELNTELVDELKTELMTNNQQQAIDIADNIKDNQQKINFHGKRADAIVKGMLQHSRTSTGQKELTDINALCDEYVRLAYHGLRAKEKDFNAKFETDFDPTIGKINLVPQDIGRVLLNLINNAFYAVSEKAKLSTDNYQPLVVVSTKKLDAKVEVRVGDNGNGVPQNVADKIFQPFFTTKPTGQGTGLGLSLSYDIVKAHGGEIKMETKKGIGSEFIFQIPQ